MSDRPWTVISAVHSTKLVDFCTKNIHLLNEAKPGLVATHILCQLEDQSQASLLSERLEEVLQAMDGAVPPENKQESRDTAATNGPTTACLVHCAFGISRSASIIAAWLIYTRRCTTLLAAMKQIRTARPEAQPNLGFCAALRALAQCDGNVTAARERLAPSNDS